MLLARALAWRAAVLLLDEVATGLDDANRARLYRAAGRRPAEAASTWICSAHREEDIPPGATHLLWLDAGRVRYAGPLQRAAVARGAGRSRRTAGRSSDVRTPVPHGRSAARAARPLITLDGANVYVDAKRVLRDVNLTIRRGECWVVHGANGAGKTTLLRTLYGDHSAASGGRIERAGQGPGVPLDDFRARTGLIAPHLQTDYPRHYSVLDTVVSGLHSSIGLNFRATAGEKRRARAALAALGMERVAQTGRWRNSPMARCGACCSRAPWCCGRGCCCWMSHSPA